MPVDTHLDLGDASSASRLAERAMRERRTARAYLLRAVVPPTRELNEELVYANGASHLNAL